MAFYKFLRDVDGQARGPFSDFAWPVPHGPGPGPWVDTALPLEVCGRGIHVCRAADIPHWLNDVLWEVEAAGELVEDDDKVVVERARLLVRVEGWPAEAAAFSEDCVWALRSLVVDAAADEGLQADADRLAACATLADLAEVGKAIDAKRAPDVDRLAAYLSDALEFVPLGKPAIVAYIAAHAADHAPRPPGHRLARGMTPFDVERRRQADWLQGRLGLR